jgi:hypothetical protein
MHAPAPTTKSAPTFRPLPVLDDAWRLNSPGARLEAVERAAPRLADAIRESGTPRAVRTFDVGRFPYPTEFAFSGACSSPVPYVWMMNRAMLIEYRDFEGQRRRLLANPSRPEGSKKAPYFQDILAKLPSFLEQPFEKNIAQVAPPIPDQLRAIGVDPASIDYVTFDHLHVQDVRPMLGAGGQYPNAALLVMPEELAAARGLHPLQRYWYVEGGVDGVRAESLITFDRDVLLGEGVALVRTPGHTDGNHTIVLNVPGGLVTISENGVAPECYAPEKSKIPGVAEHAKRRGLRAILNANTRERTCDQYTSMRLEALLAAPAERDGFPRHFPSSELVHTLLAPGVKPTHVYGTIAHGDLQS